MGWRPVEAVWCIPITKANYRAAYGRINHKDFTKDYFQIPGSIYDDTVRLLMDGDDTVNAKIEYLWPGGGTVSDPSNSQILWIGSRQATSDTGVSGEGSGVMSTGRSRSLPLWNTAP
ncbi:hypothetical protein IU436_30010, partial [Nocardia farcinica]|uniref:hypothetical protein n=1 Tax=Nocardia farcinica TaxID=37329 RepID=UPI001892FCBC